MYSAFTDYRYYHIVIICLQVYPMLFPLIYVSVYAKPPQITPMLKTPMERAMGVVNVFSTSTFCGPIVPWVKTDITPEPDNPANIMSMVAKGPPTFMPTK